MDKPCEYTMTFASVYPLHIAKVERKGRAKADLDGVIRWLTGYEGATLEAALVDERSFESFFAKAPKMNPARTKITGSICGVKVQEVEDPVIQNLRYLDKLVDELAKGKAMEKILRA